jgi:hypothetical protein
MQRAADVGRALDGAAGCGLLRASVPHRARDTTARGDRYRAARCALTTHTIAPQGRNRSAHRFAAGSAERIDSWSPVGASA